MGEAIQLSSTDLSLCQSWRRIQRAWPAYPLRVDVSYFVAEAGGAYTTDDPPHTTLSSLRVPQTG